MLRDRGILFYPLVVAAFPPVFLYAENADSGISVAEFLVPFAAILLLTTLLLVILKLIIRDSVRVSIVVSIFLVAFFSYGAIADLIWQTKVSVAGLFLARHRYMLTAVAVITLVGVSAALRYRGNLAPLMRGITIAALILVLFNAGRLVIAALEKPPQSPGSVQSDSATTAPPVGIKELPDIYYIILDTYAGEDVLQEIYQFDNSQFIDSLKRMGFFIPPEARSNYIHTMDSLASSLNMRYLSKADFSRSDLVRDSEVLRFVKSLGYQYLHFDSSFAPTRDNPYADIEFLADNRLLLLLTDYSAFLLDSTLLPPIALKLGVNVFFPFASNQANLFNEHMRLLKTIPDIPGPTFTFNHNLPPHDPWLFDRDGNPPEFRYEPGGEFNAKGYVDQLVYVSKRIEEVVTAILESSTTEPIIIVQGDHGAPDVEPLPESLDEVSISLHFTRTSILNAYYLPEFCRSGLYPGITPVNTFRLVFADCLGGDFGLLEDETYRSVGGRAIDFSQFQR